MSMDSPAWNSGAEPPPAKKSGSKVWLILGVTLGLCVVLCCGGIVGVSVYFSSQVAGMMSHDPAEVTKAQAEIADIEIPADIAPQFRFDLGMFGQQVALLVYHGGPASDNLIWMAAEGNALQQQTQGNVDNTRSQLESNLTQQAQVAQSGPFKSLSNTTQRNVEITVNGTPATISVTEGTDGGGKKFTQAEGMFTGKKGHTFIKLQLDGEKYPPDQVDAILKSIK
jgi:hypothetical protein